MNDEKYLPDFPIECNWVEFISNNQEIYFGKQASVRSLTSERYYCKEHGDKFHSGLVEFSEINFN
jgi:hypothetical protein